MVVSEKVLVQMIEQIVLELIWKKDGKMIQKTIRDMIG